jgi:restriction system protein
MSRHSFGATIRRIAREVARAERAKQQEQARHAAARIRELRNAERQTKADAKEAARLHVAAQIEEADALTHAVEDREKAIHNLLAHALANNPAVDLASLLKSFTPNTFDESPWRFPAPNRNEFTPETSGFFTRMLPGATGRYERGAFEANRRFDEAEASYRKHLQARATAIAAFEADESTRKSEVDRLNASVRELQKGLEAKEHSAVVGYFKLVIERSLNGEPNAVSAEVGYAPDSRHLVVDLELPELSVVPEEMGFRYVKSPDRIDPIIRPAGKRKALYANLLCQVALKCTDTVFRGDLTNAVECLTLNGMLDTIDPATGQNIRVCLLSVRITTDNFRTLNLRQIQPESCLRSLRASVSRAPAELLPVKPLIELDMVDPRFVATLDVMSGLDRRPNLMELTPTEFEGLITNLFAAMGLDTRQTRPSRDGGVDCVAFDSRPIFGGKVVIQAKRYKNTVGVSAVRDLFGTVQNEGASKGILVTTSGYGKAAFDFAKGKPLELLDGGNLLHLLAEHASIEARIVMPEGWVDLPIHGE